MRRVVILLRVAVDGDGRDLVRGETLQDLDEVTVEIHLGSDANRVYRELCELLRREIALDLCDGQRPRAVRREVQQVLHGQQLRDGVPLRPLDENYQRVGLPDFAYILLALERLAGVPPSHVAEAEDAVILVAHRV